MSVTLLSPAALARDLSLPDLTDPAHAPHAVGLIADEVVDALRTAWQCPVRLVRGHPVVPVDDNYVRLGYPPDAVTLDARYTRYVSETCVLRGHTSATVVRALRELAADPGSGALIACPGMCYRRDSVDRLHTGTPHQLDLWWVTDRGRLGESELLEMIDLVVGAALPGTRWRTVPTGHPYTMDGRQIDARVGGEGTDGDEPREGRNERADWIEIGECGLAAPEVLAGAGLPPERWSGLAMGLGLDRLVMLRKGIPDIRLLRATDPRTAAQLRDLSPYRAVSMLPPVRRDVSVAVDAGTDCAAEAIGDRVRAVLGDDAELVETVEVLGAWGYDEVPPPARDRLGLGPDQRNLLIRVVLRPLDRTLTDRDANQVRELLYAELHAGGRP